MCRRGRKKRAGAALPSPSDATRDSGLSVDIRRFRSQRPATNTAFPAADPQATTHTSSARVMAGCGARALLKQFEVDIDDDD